MQPQANALAGSPSADPNKAVEALYALTRSAYDFEHGRYDAAESKAGRYLTVLALVLGVVVVKVDDLAWTLGHTGLSWNWKIPFCAAYLITVGAAFAAVCLSLLTMNVSRVPALPLDDQLRELFEQHSYKDALEAVMTSFRQETKELRNINDRRTKSLAHASGLLKVILGGATISVILYVPLRFSALNSQVPGTTTGATTRVPVMTKPTTPSTPIAQPQTAPAAPPKFDHVTKGDNSPREQRTK